MVGCSLCSFLSEDTLVAFKICEVCVSEGSRLPVPFIVVHAQRFVSRDKRCD